LADYQHYNTFNLTDPRTGKTKNCLDDFGGIIINTNDETYERECMPQMNFVTDKNDNRDGEIFIKATRGSRNIDSLTLLFTEENGGGDLFELKRWLGKDYQQWFEWDGSDEEDGIWVIENGGWKSQVYYQKEFYGKIELKFIAHNPYYYKTQEKDITFTNLTTGDSKNVRCAGNVDSYPLLKITPSTTSVSFIWNDLTVILSDLTIGTTYYLDCEKCQCYYIANSIKILCFSKYASNIYIDFPSLLCEGTNTINVASGSFSIAITPRTRII